MKIRKATEKDVKGISNLIRKTIENINYKKYSKNQIGVWKKRNSPEKIKKRLKEREIFIATENNKLIGTIALQGNEIYGLYVKHDLRGKGLGKKLMEFIEDYSRKKKIKRLVLYSTPVGVDFYKSIGFKPIRKEEIDLGEVRFTETFMEKKL